MRNHRQARRLLLEWYDGAKRELPWRRTKDPWQILLSEVMLQQTRVATVLPYYERITRLYPTAGDMAAAPEKEVLAAWSGLGYYTRARNLQKAAKEIAARGGFPETHEEILSLPGVGEYTAAAVASIAYGLPHVVVDGNVIRVMSRLLGERGVVGSAVVKQRLRDEAQRMLDPARAGDFNQALMELGATVCLPKEPQCLLCPLRDHCEGRMAGVERELPVKAPKRESLKLQVRLLLAEKAGKILLRQRGEGESRMAGFWELPEVRMLPKAKVSGCVGDFRHTITHHEYTMEVFAGQVRKAPKGYVWFGLEELDGIPLATTVRKALKVAGRGIPRSDRGESTIERRRP